MLFLPILWLFLLSDVAIARQRDLQVHRCKCSLQLFIHSFSGLNEFYLYHYLTEFILEMQKNPKQVAIEIINLWIYLYIFPFILYSVDALDALVHCVYSKEKEKWFHHNIVLFRCCRTTTASLTIWLMFFFHFVSLSWASVLFTRVPFKCPF